MKYLQWEKISNGRKRFFKQVSFPESLGAEDKGKLTVSATNPQLVTILTGTPNAHTFYFQDPKNPTPAELNKIREYYGIPLDVSPRGRKTTQRFR